MSKIVKEIDITPSPSLFEKIGSVDFPTAQAISELIANSFDARIGKMPVTVIVNWDNIQLEVIDDAKGMNLDALESALTLGKTSKTDKDKGMYGLGLKSACSSLGIVLEIETCPINHDKVYGATLNFKEFSKKSQNGTGWKLNAYEMARDESSYFKNLNSHGTAILVKGLKAHTIDNKNINEWLSRAYFYHLEHNEILDYSPEEILHDKIIVNTIDLKPETFDLIPNTIEKIDIIFKPKNARITGWVALKKHSNPSIGDFGIHLYRNKQLIESYCQEFTGSHVSDDKIIGHLQLDFVNVNYNKLGFQKRGRLWTELTAELKMSLRKHKIASQVAHQKKGVNGEKRNEEDVMKRVYEKLGKSVEDLSNKEKNEVQEAIGDILPIEEGLVIPVEEIIEKASGKIILFDNRQITFQFKNIEDPTHTYRWRFHQFDPNTGRLSVFINTKSIIYESIFYKDDKSGSFPNWEYNMNKAREALKRIALIESLVQMQKNRMISYGRKSGMKQMKG